MSLAKRMSWWSAGPAPGEQPKILRRLGPLENYLSAQHLLGMYNCCGLTCRYTVPEDLRGKETALQGVFERAVALAVLEHPLLQVGLKDEDSPNPSWLWLDHIDLRNHIQWRWPADSKSFDMVMLGILEHEHDKPFTELETRPGWKLKVFATPGANYLEVFFAWNHANGDGMSGKIFQETLLEKLNIPTDKQVVPALQDHMLKFDPSTALTPNQEQLLHLPITPWYAICAEWSDIRPKWVTPVNPYEVTWASMSEAQCKTKLKLFSVKKNDLFDVLAACREHGVTLTALLHALALLSFATRLPDMPAFAADTPVSARRFVKQEAKTKLTPERTIGNIVTNEAHWFDPTLVSELRGKLDDVIDGSDSAASELEATIWKVAAKVREDLIKKLASGLRNAEIGLIKLAGDWRPRWRQKLRVPREKSWEFSNLGVIDGKKLEAGEQNGHWSIERALFTQSASPAAAAIWFSVVSVKGGDLCVTCTWQDEVIDQEFIGSVMSDLGLWLEGLGRSGSIRIGDMDEKGAVVKIDLC